MKFASTVSGRRWRYVVTVLLFFTGLVSAACLADQLQWNPASTCVSAAKAIGRCPLIVSYCSRADADYVSLWLARDARIVPTSAVGLYELMISARCLYRSVHPYAPDELLLAGERQTISKVDEPVWIKRSLDLAYVYIHTGGGTFRCLGRLLGLDCSVAVESIALPAGVMEELTARAHPMPLLWPLDPAFGRGPILGR